MDFLYYTTIMSNFILKFIVKLQISPKASLKFSSHFVS